MINLNTYFAMHPTLKRGTCDVYWMILKYFTNHRDVILPTQAVMCIELKREFNLTKNRSICTQGAVSKALKKIQDQDIKIGTNIYRLVKDKAGYTLQKKTFGKISDLVGIGDIFEKEQVYELTSNTLVFLFKEGGAEKFKGELNRIYTEDVFFKLLIHENTLFMMFNDKHYRFSKTFSEMIRFFDERGKYLKRVEIEKLRLKKEREEAEKFKAQQRKFQEELEEVEKTARK